MIHRSSYSLAHSSWGQSSSSTDKWSMDIPVGHITAVSTRHPVNDPLPESLKSVLGNQEHRWDMQWPSTDIWNMIDSSVQPSGTMCILLPNHPSAVHLLVRCNEFKKGRSSKWVIKNIALLSTSLFLYIVSLDKMSRKLNQLQNETLFHVVSICQCGYKGCLNELKHLIICLSLFSHLVY